MSELSQLLQRFTGNSVAVGFDIDQAGALHISISPTTPGPSMSAAEFFAERKELNEMEARVLAAEREAREAEALLARHMLAAEREAGENEAVLAFMNSDPFKY